MAEPIGFSIFGVPCFDPPEGGFQPDMQVRVHFSGYHQDVRVVEIDPPLGDYKYLKREPGVWLMVEEHVHDDGERTDYIKYEVLAEHCELLNEPETCTSCRRPLVGNGVSRCMCDGYGCPCGSDDRDYCGCGDDARP